jgi:hypothetical protein
MGITPLHFYPKLQICTLERLTAKPAEPVQGALGERPDQAFAKYIAPLDRPVFKMT